MALSEAVGPASFSRAYGLATTSALPFTVIGVQTASALFVRTGTYATVIVAMIVVLLLISPMPYYARRRRVACDGSTE
jgi:hypothetical protein